MIGLDGATFDFIRPLWEEGRLPALRALAEEGSFGTLRSTVPPISAPAWASFMTGVNPGKHGIFGFTECDISDPTWSVGGVVNSGRIAGRTMFDLLSSAGRKVGVMKMPMCYPPWGVNGFMVAGSPTPDWREAYTYPHGLSERMGQVGLYSGSGFYDLDVDDQLAHIEFDVEKHTDMATLLMNEDSYDLFIIVYNFLDHAQHHYRKFIDPLCPNYDPDGARKYGDLIASLYERADALIARFLDEVDEQTTVFIVSDHGGKRVPTRRVRLNHWLRSRGFLHPKEPASRAKGALVGGILSTINSRVLVNHRLRAGLKRLLPVTARRRVAGAIRGVDLIDWSSTRAYHVSMKESVEGIVINLKGRQPGGIVAPGKEYQRLRDTLVHQLGNLRDSQDQPIANQVLKREELYSGPHLENAPDIVLMLNDGYAAAPGFEPPLVTPVQRLGPEEWSGIHSMEGILLARGPGLRAGFQIEGSQIVDMAPTLLFALEAAVPSDMDGRVLVEVFKPAFAKRAPIKYGDPFFVREKMPQMLSGEEEAAMKRNLEGLGYL